MDPGCTAADGEWYSTESVKLWEPPSGPPGPPPPLYFPQPCIIPPVNISTNETLVNGNITETVLTWGPDLNPTLQYDSHRCGFLRSVFNGKILISY